MFLWAISAVPFGVYAIIQNFALPIQIQPQVFCALSLFTWAQILIYNNGYTTLKAIALTTTIAISFGGAEALLIFTLKPLYDRGIAWPLMIVGVMAAILLAAGLLPPYFELWKRKGRVVGIHFGFLTVDWLGAFFSLMGVIAQETFDPLGGCLFIVWYVDRSSSRTLGMFALLRHSITDCVLYSVFIEGGIFVSHGIWLLRTRKLRKEAKLAGICFDDLPEAEEYHVEVTRKGSIAASRDAIKDQIERRGSLALARDLERGDEMLAGSVNLTRSCTLGKPMNTVSEVSSSKSSTFTVTEEEVKPDGVDTVDYGTMSRSASSASRTRPGYARQDTNMSTLTVFKEPQW